MKYAEPHQLVLDWNPETVTEIPEGASSGRSYGFDCSAQRFAEMEIIRLRARAAVKEALKSGRLTRPAACERCGDPGKPESHHTDYALPLDVQWLCFSCHKKETRGLAVRARMSLPNEIHRPGFRGIPSWIVRAIRKGERIERSK
jgi:hypothetical protein